MDDSLILADRFEGISHPGGLHPIVGHRAVIANLLLAHKSAHMHHGILLSGEKGIGKTTLAMRLAAHLFEFSDATTAPAQLQLPSADNPVFAKIAAGAHPNLLYLSRPWDHKTKKFKTKLTVEEIRQTVSFFGTTRAEEGWRIAIVDAIDDTNSNAANALLKILEEPPERTVFFVIAHSIASVLPTIRSRCLHIPMKPLDADELLMALEGIGVLNDVGEGDRELLVSLAQGSVRRAILLAREDGLALYRSFGEICANLDQPDWGKIHTLADGVSTRGNEDRYRLVFNFANEFMEAHARGKGTPGKPISTLARWAEVWEKTRNSVRMAEGYNLDKKQVILNLFHDLGEAARS